MKRGLIALAAAVALVAVPLAAADADFTDPAGDGAGAPDVTTVAVANDSLNRVAFEVGIAGNQPLPDDGQILIWIDSDQNADTGSGGWDYLAVVASDESSLLLGWDGTQFVEAPSTTARAYVIAGYILYGIDRAELGATAVFDFFVNSIKITNDEIVAEDVAPDGDAYWTYATVTKAYGLFGSPLTVTPKPPRVATKVIASFATFRTDSLEPLEGSKSTCVATVAGKRITTRITRAALGFVQCETVRLLKTAKGKLLKLTLTTTAGGKSVVRTYSARVR